MPLALVIFAIGLLIWKKIRDEKTGWQRRDRFYVFALLTIAMLIKGPIVYAFLLAGIGVFEWWRRRRAAVAAGGDPDRAHDMRMQQSAWPGSWPWLASLAVFLLWVIGGILFEPGFFNEVVMREFMARFGETIHRPQPLYFYLPHLLHKFAPWSLLLLAIAFGELISRNWRLRPALRQMSPEVFWLLCWSLGGLIVMSLIPSKRVDRIFPVIPPLCLLLAAQIGRVGALRRTDPVPWWRPYLAVVLVFAIVFTGGYTISKVISGYRHDRDALAVFGSNVRRDATMHHWRYEAVSAKDESLLLYLQKTRFIEPAEAIAEWTRGNLDALVVSTQKAPGLMRDLRDAALSDLKSTARKEEQEEGYVLITR
jgi:4-amino-4-deoxy-L-arabinose transferase-like glycosyltransferase